jgi:hypothetical protein
MKEEPQDKENEPCPICKTPMSKLCELDHKCICVVEVQGGIQICPKCKKLVCACGGHDCVGITRITGYYSEISGYNAAKYQEVVKDRKHYEIE